MDKMRQKISAQNAEIKELKQKLVRVKDLYEEKIRVLKKIHDIDMQLRMTTTGN